MIRDFLLAARMGDLHLLKQLLGRNSDYLLSTTPKGNNAVHIAAKHGHTDLVEELLQRCDELLVSRNSDGDTPLHIASRAGRAPVVQYLINYKKGIDDIEIEGPSENTICTLENNKKNTALHEAVLGKHSDVVKLLLTEDGDLACRVNEAEESPIYLAAEVGSLDIIHYIMVTASEIAYQGPNGRSPLHAAVIRGHLEVAKHLIKERPNLIKKVDDFKSTALHYAASTGHQEIVEQLLLTDSTLVYLKDENGHSPLHLAAGAGYQNIVRELLDFCPDASELLDDKGRNALHIAVDGERTETVEELLKLSDCKDLINEFDNDGNTAMHIAAKKEYYSMVKLLLESPDVNLRSMDKEGRTAFDCIEFKPEQSYEQIIIWNALQEAGAARGQRLHKGHQHPVQNPLAVGADSYKSMANTLSLVATLIATVTYTSIFTMPGDNSSRGTEKGSAPSINTSAHTAFVISDTVAMCSSMVVALVLVWAVPSVPGMLVNAVRWSLKLMWVALGGMIVSFVTAVYISVNQDSFWLAVVVCIIGCSIPFVVTSIVSISARNMPRAKKEFQYNQISPFNSEVKEV